MVSRPVRSALALFGAGLLILAAAGVAAAHATPERSDPAKDAALDHAPATVTIWFTEPIEPARSSIVVVGPSGATVSRGGAQPLPNDPKVLRVSLAPGLGPGRYTVSWKSVSIEDGDEASGSFSFTIGAAGAMAAPAGGGAAESHEEEGHSHDDAAARVPAALPRAGEAPSAPAAALLALAGLALVAGGLRLRLGRAPAVGHLELPQ